jgi:hypothetical protein
MQLRLLACLSVILLAACGGPELTKVTGIVKYKGNPVSNATVVFTPDGDGVVGAATTDSNGKYALGSTKGAGVPAGAYSVKIKSQVKPETDSDPMAGLTPGSPEYERAYMEVAQSSREARAYRTKKDPNAIPAKYDTGSELKALVDRASTQEINFDLE